MAEGKRVDLNNFAQGVSSVLGSESVCFAIDSPPLALMGHIIQYIAKKRAHVTVLIPGAAGVWLPGLYSHALWPSRETPCGQTLK